MAAEKTFPYTPVPNSLKRLLEMIPTIGAPEKASQEWLASIGLSGGNNKRSLAVIRAVGVIDTQGRPTSLWVAIRSKDGATFAAGLRKHYADLFATYPDADRKDDEALIAFIRSKTNYAEQAQRLAARTFKVLCEFGDFGAEAARQTLDADVDEEDDDDNGVEVKPEKRRGRAPAGGDGRIALTVNLQLQLPASEDGVVYDKLFAAMAKHLKGLVSSE
jgi:hypothetical protein